MWKMKYIINSCAARRKKSQEKKKYNHENRPHPIPYYIVYINPTTVWSCREPQTRHNNILPRVTFRPADRFSYSPGRL